MAQKFRWQHHVTPLEDPVVNHPILQAQRHHAQLGQISALFPSATHTRYHHCGYTGHVAGAIFDVLAKKGRQPGSRNDIVAAAKLHDGGHGPICHGLEYLLEQLTGINHKQRIISLINSDVKDGYGRTPHDALRAAHADPRTVISLLQEDPPIVSDVWRNRVVGADSLAYLHMDTQMVGFDQDPPDWEILIENLAYFDGLVLDIPRTLRPLYDPIGMTCGTQQIGQRMYTGLYHGRPSIGLQRPIQKSVELSIRAGAFTAHAVWDMEDQTLIDRIKNGVHAPDQSTMENARMLISLYINREPFVPAATFRYEQFARPDELPIEEPFGIAFANTYRDPRKLTSLEDQLEKKLGVPVLLALFPDPAKLRPRDIRIYSGGTQVSTLREECPAHFKALEEQANRCFYIDILVP